jgi:hypothetical protein
MKNVRFAPINGLTLKFLIRLVFARGSGHEEANLVNLSAYNRLC